MIDALIIVAYFIIVLYAGLRSGREIKNINQFAIGNRNFSATTLVVTLTATLIGGGTTFGLAEKPSKFGIFMLVTIPVACFLGLIDIGGFSTIKAMAPLTHLDLRYRWG